jgi:hypothetical protein
MQPDMQRRQVEAAAAARNTQALAHQANQAIFTQKLPDAARPSGCCCWFSAADEGVDTALIDARNFCPGLQFTLLALQLFKQFGADIAAFNHIQQIATLRKKCSAWRDR